MLVLNIQTCLVKPLEHCGELWPGELESDGEHEIDLRHDPRLDVGVSGEVEGG